MLTLEVVQNDDVALRPAYPLDLLKDLGRIRDDANDVSSEDVIERIVREAHSHSIHYGETDVGSVELADSRLGLSEHLPGEVHPHQSVVVGVQGEVKAGTDPDLKNPILRAGFQDLDGLDPPGIKDPVEDEIVYGRDKGIRLRDRLLREMPT
jgi:hypothetical protein